MTSPLQAIDINGDRYYPWNGTNHISVTTVIGSIGKGDGIVQWAANCAADKAIEQFVKWGDCDPGFPTLDRNTIRYAWKEQRDKAGRTGDMAHAWIEHFLKTGEQLEPAKEIRGHVKQFMLWYERHEVRPIHVEPTVYSTTHGYAGSCDLFAEVDGRVLCVDVKTSKSLHGTVALQTAAYCNADFILTDDGEILPIPEVDGCAVLHVRPRSLKFKELMPPEKAFPHFLRQLETKRDWHDGAENRAIGPDILPRKR